MSKFKDNYLPSDDPTLVAFEKIYIPFMKSIGGRYNCDSCDEYVSDGSLGWPEGIKIKEIKRYEKFYASYQTFFDFYKLIQEKVER